MFLLYNRAENDLLRLRSREGYAVKRRTLAVLLALLALLSGVGRAVPPADAAETHVHVWLKTEETLATCEKAGRTVYTCALCGESYVYNENAYGAHEWTETVQKAPTCKTEGVLLYTCTRCGKTRTEAIPAVGVHTYSVTTKTPVTCGGAGVLLYVCEYCGDTAEQTLPPTAAHTWGAPQALPEPTCTSEGTALYTCAVCKKTKDEAYGARGTHVWAAEVRQEPDCASPGVMRYVCAVCGADKLEPIPTTQTHRWTETQTTAPTCTKTGQTVYLCAGCGVTKKETIAATGRHAWDAGTVTRAATVSSEGVKTYRCASCGTTKTEAVPALYGGNYAEALARLPRYIPPAPQVTAAHGTFTFIMYGNGDGVGMSQQGAVIMAQAGLPYDYILSYYYVGTTIAAEPYPSVSYYRGSWVNTQELLARIIQMEIGDGSPYEAQKAQGVAAFTMLKYYHFYVTDETYVHVGAAKADYASCAEGVKRAAAEVVGQYLIMAGDETKSPALAEYHDMCAGHTLNAWDAWGGGSFPVSVPSPFDGSAPGFITAYSCTVDDMRRRILAWDPTVRLSQDPADWIEILSHDASLDATRGYVTEIRLGNKTLKGIGKFNAKILSLKSACFTVFYTP